MGWNCGGVGGDLFVKEEGDYMTEMGREKHGLYILHWRNKQAIRVERRQFNMLISLTITTTVPIAPRNKNSA